MTQRTVKFVRKIVVEELPFRGESIRYTETADCPHVLSAEGVEYLAENQTVQQRVISVLHICHSHGAEDVYLAYSKEVEDLLRLPFNVLLESRAAAQAAESAALDRLETSEAAHFRCALREARLLHATLWERIVFACTGRQPK